LDKQDTSDDKEFKYSSGKTTPIAAHKMINKAQADQEGIVFLTEIKHQSVIRPKLPMQRLKLNNNQSHKSLNRPKVKAIKA
jgi:hypothetical protein